MKPKYLDKYNTIYLVAPSFGCTTNKYKKRLDKSIENFKTLNQNIIIGDNVYKNEGIIASNTPENRAKEINAAFSSNANLVLSVGGGEVMNQILPYVNFDIIKNNPKWFVGFSDNTNLTYTITTILDMETIYGVNGAGYYNYPFEYDSLDTWELLHGKLKFKGYKQWQYAKDNKILAKYNFDKKTRITNVNFTKLKGRLIGGCLDCLQALCGTKFDNTKEYIKRHKDEGVIFFLETCDFNTAGVIRALEQLKNADWFKDIKGFIIGRSLNYYDKSFNINMIDAYISVLKDLNLPMLINIDLGHLAPSLPIRCGALATVEYKNNNVYITYDE